MHAAHVEGRWHDRIPTEVTLSGVVHATTLLPKMVDNFARGSILACSSTDLENDLA
jgi:hypothetical protein